MSGPGDNFLPNGAPNPLPGGLILIPFPLLTRECLPWLLRDLVLSHLHWLVGSNLLLLPLFPDSIFSLLFPCPMCKPPLFFLLMPPFYFSELQGIPMPMGIRFPSPQLPMFFSVPPPSVPHVLSPPLTSTVVKKTKTTKSSTVVKKKKKTIWSNNSAAASPIPRGRDRRGVGGDGIESQRMFMGK